MCIYIYISIYILYVFLHILVIPLAAVREVPEHRLTAALIFEFGAQAAELARTGLISGQFHNLRLTLKEVITTAFVAAV